MDELFGAQYKFLPIRQLIQRPLILRFLAGADELGLDRVLTHLYITAAKYRISTS